MAFSILVIHDFKVTANIIRNYVLAELGEQVTKLLTTNSSQEAIDIISQQKLDLVISGRELLGHTGIDIFNHLKRTELNSHTPFILVVSNDHTPNTYTLQGIQHTIQTPFTQTELRVVIDHACDFRKSRKNERYSILGAKATIQIGQIIIPATIINLSSSGILCKFSYIQSVNIMDIAKLTIHLPADFYIPDPQGISMTPVRIQIESWNQQFRPDEIKVAWKFTYVSEEAKDSLDRIFKKLVVDISKF
ncbi:MAG: response regulator [Desulfobacterales bacterium]|nr:response regulator [Desulfobacterales bacterium]